MGCGRWAVGGGLWADTNTAAPLGLGGAGSLALSRVALSFCFPAAKGAGSKHADYIALLPANVSSMAFYWSDDELACAVPRYASRAV